MTIIKSHGIEWLNKKLQIYSNQLSTQIMMKKSHVLHGRELHYWELEVWKPMPVRAQRCKENACIPWQLHVINVGSWLGNIKSRELGIFPKLSNPQFPTTWASTSASGLLPGQQQPLPVWDFRRINWDWCFSSSDLSSTWMWSSSCLPWKSNMIKVLPLWKKEWNYSLRKIQNLANRS